MIWGHAARTFRLRPSSSAKATPIKAAARNGSSSSPAVASRMPPRGCYSAFASASAVILTRPAPICTAAASASNPSSSAARPSMFSA